MIIREIRPADAEQFLRLGKLLDAETQFMLREPGEREITVAQQQREIEYAHQTIEGRNHGRGDPLRSPCSRPNY